MQYLNSAMPGPVNLHRRYRGKRLFERIEIGALAHILREVFYAGGRTSIVTGYENMHRGRILYDLNTGLRAISDNINEIWHLLRDIQ